MLYLCATSTHVKCVERNKVNCTLTTICFRQGFTLCTQFARSNGANWTLLTFERSAMFATQGSSEFIVHYLMWLFSSVGCDAPLDLINWTYFPGSSGNILDKLQPCSLPVPSVVGELCLTASM